MKGCPSTFSSLRHWAVPDVVEQILGCTAEWWRGAPKGWRARSSIALGTRVRRWTPQTRGHTRSGSPGLQPSSWPRCTRSPARERDKDALDVLRLLRAVETTRLAAQLDVLGHDPLSAAVTTEARRLFNDLFTRHDNRSCRNVRPCGQERGESETLAASMMMLASDLLDVWP